MVFVGYGVNAPERNWDDFKGVDVKGKVAVFLVNDPDFEAAAGEPVAGKFGGQTMTAALRLDTEAPQDSPNEALQVRRHAGLYRVSSLVAGTWQPLYECSLEPFLPVDYETANWYVSTHPASRFVTNLICSRVDDGVRHVLLDRRHALYRGDGSSEVREVRSREELGELLSGIFRINVAAAPASLQALDRLFEEGA